MTPEHIKKFSRKYATEEHNWGTGSCGASILITAAKLFFQDCYTNLYSHQKCIKSFTAFSTFLATFGNAFYTFAQHFDMK